MTEAEVIVWSQLRKRAQRSALFRRQAPIGHYAADFACIAARLVLEIDGATHSSDAEIAHDAKRTAYLTQEGWTVLRFTNDDVYRRLGKVMDAIWAAVDSRMGR
jgi:very-short-patch-repair endonuclease